MPQVPKSCNLQKLENLNCSCFGGHGHRENPSTRLKDDIHKWLSWYCECDAERAGCVTDLWWAEETKPWWAEPLVSAGGVDAGKKQQSLKLLDEVLWGRGGGGGYVVLISDCVISIYNIYWDVSIELWSVRPPSSIIAPSLLCWTFSTGWRTAEFEGVTF